MLGAMGYAVTGLIGLVVGASELASRYRDSVGRSIVRPASVIYLATNVGASTAALAVIRTFGWTFGQSGPANELVQVLVAGVGSVALFRTKLFTGEQQGSEISWSPAGLLERILAISDRQVDRDQAHWRSQAVPRIMRNVSFELAYASLPSYALALLENPTREAQKELADDVKALRDDKQSPDEAKVLLLGVAILRITGVRLLEDAVTGLGATIEHTPE